MQTVAIILTQWDTFVIHGGDINYANTYSIPARVALSVVSVPVILAKCLFAERCHWVSRQSSIRVAKLDRDTDGVAQVSRSVPVVSVGVAMIFISAVGSLGSIISRRKSHPSLVDPENDSLTTAMRLIVHPSYFGAQAVQIWFGVYLWSAVASDVWLTGAFAWSIRRMRKENALHPACVPSLSLGTHEIILTLLCDDSASMLLSHLLRIALLTSGLTTVGAVAAAIAQLFASRSNAYVAFLQIMPQAYMLSVLITRSSPPSPPNPKTDPRTQ